MQCLGLVGTFEMLDVTFLKWKLSEKYKLQGIHIHQKSNIGIALHNLQYYPPVFSIFKNDYGGQTHTVFINMLEIGQQISKLATAHSLNIFSNIIQTT